jgi:hypothetical protein
MEVECYGCGKTSEGCVEVGNEQAAGGHTWDLMKSEEYMREDGLGVVPGRGGGGGGRDVTASEVSEGAVMSPSDI